MSCFSIKNLFDSISTDEFFEKLTIYRDFNDKYKMSERSGFFKALRDI